MSILQGRAKIPGVSGGQAPKALVKVLLEVLKEAGPSLLVANMETRRPELLDIRPLPQYATLEEALKVRAASAEDGSLDYHAIAEGA
jgi:hypothetical protein